MNTLFTKIIKDLLFTWEALPEHDKYRGGQSHPIIELREVYPMEALEKGCKELNEFSAQLQEHYEPPSTPRDTRGLTTNERVHMEGPMTLDAYAAEDSLFGHQREDNP